MAADVQQEENEKIVPKIKLLNKRLESTEINWLDIYILRKQHCGRNSRKKAAALAK